MNSHKVLKILTLLREAYAPVTPDLDYNNIYQLTIAVVLSAQTTDVQVNAVTPTLFKKYPDFKTLARGNVSDIESIIKSTGFYKVKARNILALAQKIMEVFNGLVPESEDELLILPGVGRKSSNVILSMGYDIPALAVDTHVARIAQRLGFTIEENTDKIERDLTSQIPKKDWIEAHLLFIRHGRNTCKARSPLCSACILVKICPSAETFLNDV